MATGLTRDFTYVNDWGPGSGWTHYIQGPALAILSWIPYYRNRDELPECVLKSHWDEYKAIEELLPLGNHRPNEGFDGAGEFLRDPNLKGFRAALVIDAPKLYLAEIGKVTGVTFLAMGRVGYTPLRKWNFVWNAEGFGTGDCKVRMQPNERTIECWYRFKLGWAAGLEARRKTGHWPASANVKAKYVMEDSGRITITVFGSHFPSHTVYLDWRSPSESCKYRMGYACTADQFRRFVEAGSCVTAPISEICRIEYQGQKTVPV